VIGLGLIYSNAGRRESPAVGGVESWRWRFGVSNATLPRTAGVLWRDGMSDEKPRPADASAEGPVPKAVVARLSLYLRELQRLVRDGHETTSSNQLGNLLGFSDAQVRKDLAYFGHFGYPGIGYRCEELIGAIRKILGTDRGWPVAMVGAGNLGRALLGYKGFGNQNFRIAAAFDTDPEKVGASIDGVKVHHLDELSEVVRQRQIRLGMIVVPAVTAQAVADRLVAAGIEGIVNFAPVTLALPPGVSLVGVDLAIELEQLSFAVLNRPNA
jgi:redox-sensing transcriptional repressor